MSRDCDRDRDREAYARAAAFLALALDEEKLGARAGRLGGLEPAALIRCAAGAEPELSGADGTGA